MRPSGGLTVVRGQSFAGHAFADITANGGSAAFLLGVSPLFGFVVMALAGASATELLGAERQRGRTWRPGSSSVPASGYRRYCFTSRRRHKALLAPPLRSFSVDLRSQHLDLAAGDRLRRSFPCSLGLVYRPLLLSSINPDLARAQGLGLRVVGLIYMVSLALSVALSALTIGAILSTALLIGRQPRRCGSRKPARAIACAALIGVTATWAGIVLAYDSYNWPPAQQGWPVSFFVVSLVLAAYLLAQLTGRPRRWA